MVCMILIYVTHYSRIIENLNSRLKYTNTPTLITTWYLPEPLNWCSETLGTLLAQTPWRGDRGE